MISNHGVIAAAASKYSESFVTDDEEQPISKREKHFETGLHRVPQEKINEVELKNYFSKL